ADGKADGRQQPAGDERTDDADDDVSDQPEPVPLHDLSSEPTSYGTHDEEDDNRFDRHVWISATSHAATGGFCGTQAATALCAAAETAERPLQRGGGCRSGGAGDRVVGDGRGAGGVARRR